MYTFLNHCYDSIGESGNPSQCLSLSRRTPFDNGDNNNDDIRTERRNSRCLQSSHCATNCLQHVRSSGPGRIRVKITCKTSSTCHVQHAVCHLVRRDSSAFKSDRVEIAFILTLFYCLKPLTDEGGEETGVPREKSRRRASENATFQSPKIQAPSETRTRTLALVVG